MSEVKTLYKTATKQAIAQAYGFAKTETLVNRLRERITPELPEEMVKKLNTWTGHGALLPDQVEVIVYLLGTPQDPDALIIRI